MIRIAQKRFPDDIFDRLIHDRDLLASIMREHLPLRFLNMFPQPLRPDSEHVVWHSELSGALRMLVELPTRQGEQALETLRLRFESIHQVIVDRRSAGDLSPEQANRLHDMLNTVPQEAIAVVGDEPLVLYWTSAMPPGQSMPLLPLGPFILPEATVEPTAPRRPWLWWLLALLALALLLWALWWFFCPVSPRQASEPIVVPEVILPVEPEKEDPPIVEPPQPEPVVVPEPELIVAPPEPPVVETPVEPPKPPDLPVKPPQPPKPAVKKPVTITNAKEFCPDERPAELVPEMVVVFDASGSMALNIAATSEQEEEYYNAVWRRNTTPGRFSMIDEKFVDQMEREPKRITVAKNAVSDVVKGLPKDMNVGLVTARTCPGADFKGFFPPQRRSALLGQIKALQPDGGTPLADALRRAGHALDGRGRESTILVVTDGVESCNGDPCAVARQLAASKPHLKINVVDIGQSGSGNCLANATGGRVYPANSVDGLKQALARATKDVKAPAHCR